MIQGIITSVTIQPMTHLISDLDLDYEHISLQRQHKTLARNSCLLYPKSIECKPFFTPRKLFTRKLGVDYKKLSNLVFPQPGGPHRIMEGIFPVWSRDLQNPSRPHTSSCPKYSSSFEGRIDSARGR